MVTFICKGFVFPTKCASIQTVCFILLMKPLMCLISDWLPPSLIGPDFLFAGVSGDVSNILSFTPLRTP